MAKIGKEQVRDVAQRRYDKLVGKSDDAKQIENRQREERAQRMTRGPRPKSK